MTNCYDCKYRQSAIGSDPHSTCTHPYADPIGLIQIMAYGHAFYNSGLQVEGKQQGIIEGWFLWPINYDPIWLISCNGFVETPSGGDTGQAV